ncbi:MAG: PQQ-binding-like beta-propeller repeat protein [Planctomycetota bacterium]
MKRLSTLMFVAGLVAVLLPAAGCSPPPGLTIAQRIDLLPVENAQWRRMGYRISWKVAPPLAPDEEFVRTVISDTLLLTQISTGEITAFSTETGDSGRRLWSTNLANPLTRYTGMAVEGDRVIVTSQAEVFGVEANSGNLLTRQSFGSLVNTPPLVLGEVVVVGSNNGELFGHFLATGFKAWGHQIRGPLEVQPVMVDGTVGIVSSIGRVLFVDPVSFRQTSQGEVFNGPGAPLTAGDGLMFVPSLDQSLYAFDPRERRPVWRYLTPDAIREPAVFHNGVVYCAFREAGMTALDAGTGELLWENAALRGRVIGTRNGRLLVWDNDRLSLIDPQRGVELDSILVPNVKFIEADSFEDGNLYITSNEGVVARFEPAS